jgi:CelD/BcsL family acetyltransferase involved in cellulose biosynthesis
LLHLETIQAENAWSSLKDDWNTLLKNSATDVPFLRHEYLTAWWQHRGGGEWPADSQLNIVLARNDDGELRAIAPLFRSLDASGRPVLLLLGSIEISDFLDFIAPADVLNEFCEALLAYLSEPGGPDWHCLDLYNLLEGSPTLAALAQAAEKAGLRFNQARLQPAPVIALPGTFEAYFEMLEGKDRQELRRKLRNANGFFLPVGSYIVEDGSTLDDEFEAFTALMIQEPDKAEFLTPLMKEQMRAIFKAAWEAGFLRLTFMTVGGEKAAGLATFDYNNRIWGYNGGMNKKYEKLGPGVVFMGMDLEKTIQTGYEAYDLMRGDEEYKYRFGAKDRWVIRATVGRN